MNKYYETNGERFSSETKARQKFEELKIEAQKTDNHIMIELWEVTMQEDIFKRKRTVKQLITRYTHNLPNNGVFRIHDTADVRKAGKLYSLQKYDDFNECWRNVNLGNSVPELIRFMESYMEVV